MRAKTQDVRVCDLLIKTKNVQKEITKTVYECNNCCVASNFLNKRIPIRSKLPVSDIILIEFS